MQKTKQTRAIRRLVVSGMLAATVAVLMLTGLGFLRIGPMSASLLCLPILIGVMSEGLGVGLVLGLAFGLLSLIQAFSAPTLFSPYFMNPLISVLPRLCIPVVTWLVLHAHKPAGQANPKQKVMIRGLAAFAGSATNTILVLGAIYVACMLGFLIEGIAMETVGALLLGIVLTNGLPEAIVMSIVTPSVMAALDRTVYKTHA